MHRLVLPALHASTSWLTTTPLLSLAIRPLNLQDAAPGNLMPRLGLPALLALLCQVIP